MNRGPSVVDVRSLASAELDGAERVALRRLFDAAWPDGDFTDDDWDHATGGRHWLASIDGRIVSHASVVERTLWVAERSLRAGYLEAVATEPTWQRRGLGTRLVRAASAFIRDAFELGALSTGSPRFYERLGWSRWLGPTYVRAPGGLERTAAEDGGILVLRTPRSPVLDPRDPISCDWRRGDAW